jgi:hypothetical protein
LNKKEIFELIKRNEHGRLRAITLIADFMGITRQNATDIYEKEYIRWLEEGV